MNSSNVKIKSPVFIFSLLLFVVVMTAVIFIPKSSWKNIFNVNKFATVFVTSDALYDRAVYRNWTVSGSAWGESVGWLTFAPAASSKVYVADDALSGYIYGENIGWISLSCRNSGTCSSGVAYGVSNNAQGGLSGYAWGENVGWIDFGTSTGAYQVTISNSGVFSGYAYGENIGFIKFGIGADSAETTWRPRASRAQCDDGLDNDSNTLKDYPADTGCSSLTDTTEFTAPRANAKRAAEIEASGELEVGGTEETETLAEAELEEALNASGKPTAEKPEVESLEEDLAEINTVPVPVVLPEKLVLKPLPTFSSATTETKNTFSFVPKISSFLFAPLPAAVSNVLNKTPELKKYLSSVGVTKEQDLVTLSKNPILIPEVNNIPNLFVVSVGTTTLKRYISSESNIKLIELVRVASGTPVTVSITPANNKTLSGTWNGQAIVFSLNKNIASYNLFAPSAPGKYTLTSSASPMSLVIEVIERPTVQPTKVTKTPGWLTKVLGWFGR